MNLPRTFADSPSAYTEFEEIPDDLRLNNFQSAYENVDLWKVFFENYLESRISSESYLATIERAERSWKDICNRNQIHHGLANPEVVDKWVNELLTRMAKENAYRNYLSVINRFYRYLKWNIDYPHTYNPAQFAVKNFESSRKVWESVQNGGLYND